MSFVSFGKDFIYENAIYIYFLFLICTQTSSYCFCSNNTR